MQQRSGVHAEKKSIASSPHHPHHANNFKSRVATDRAIAETCQPASQEPISLHLAAHPQTFNGAPDPITLAFGLLSPLGVSAAPPEEGLAATHYGEARRGQEFCQCTSLRRRSMAVLETGRTLGGWPIQPPVSRLSHPPVHTEYFEVDFQLNLLCTPSRSRLVSSRTVRFYLCSLFATYISLYLPIALPTS